MKTFNQLTDKQKEGAGKEAFDNLIEIALQVGTDFFPDHLCDKVQTAVNKAEQMQTPWFTHEYLLDDPDIKAWLVERAAETAKHAIYPEPGEVAIYLDHSLWTSKEERMIQDLPANLEFVVNSQDVQAVKEHLGGNKDLDEYNAFFVGIEDGDYTEVWGFTGTVPYLGCTATRLL